MKILKFICFIIGHSGKYDGQIGIDKPWTCKRCGYKRPGIKITCRTPMPPVKPLKKEPRFAFNPKASNERNLMECLQGMTRKYCDRDDKDQPKPAEDQSCPFIAEAMRVIYGIELNKNPPPF